MKNFVLAAVAAVSVLLFSSGAKAQSFGAVLDVTGCRWTTTSDVGTSKYGYHTEGCRCRDTTCYPVIVSSSCTGSYNTQTGTTISGGKCCANFNSQPNCLMNDVASNEEMESVQTANSGDLSDVYGPVAPKLVDAYYGYVSTTNRSPSTGRATSIKARLDICIGSTDVDTAVANGVSWCQNTGCGAAANEYCEATGTNNGQSGVFAAVCKDRCECMINGVAHSTCDQL
jgi:hypothetical protein